MQYRLQTTTARIYLCNNPVYILGVRLPSSNVLDSAYYEELYNLLEVYDVCSQTGETIILGDLNADLRVCATAKSRAKTLHRVLNERNLISVLPLDVNTMYTYASKCKSHTSMIDYVFIDRDRSNNVTGFCIYTHTPYSVSDHCPLFVCISINANVAYKYKTSTP